MPTQKESTFSKLRPVIKLKKPLPKDEILYLVEEAKGEQLINDTSKLKNLFSRHA